MAPKSSISTAQHICCCIFKPMPEGFSWRRVPVWLKLSVLCRSVVCHILFWFSVLLVIFWLILLPEEPKFTVTNASLTQFNFNSSDKTSATNLHYHLALNITIRNPNRRIGIFYQSMAVSASYRKEFGLESLTDSVPFYQGQKNTTFLPHLVFQGQQQLVKFGKHDISQFDKETAIGVYSINLQVTFRVKIKYGKYKLKFLKLIASNDQQINCKLKLPLSLTNETSAGGFKLIYFHWVKY